MAAPVRLDNDPDALTQTKLGRRRQVDARYWSTVYLEPALEELTGRLADVTEEDIIAFFVAKGFDDDRAVHVVRALQLYQHGDFDSSAHKLLPRVEHLIRVRAAAFASVIQPTDGSSRGGVDTLGTLLETMETHIPEDWRQYLRTILTDEVGLNLRNDLLHGLRPAATITDASLIIHVLFVCCFPTRLLLEDGEP